MISAATRTTSHRILAQGRTISNDTWQTRLNNNDLIIGISGGGKTRGYVRPNLAIAEESLIVADTKGNLWREMRHDLERRGYRVLLVDFRDLRNSCGYNPLIFIRRDPKTGRYNEQDIMTIASCLVPGGGTPSDPFWENAARMYITAMIAYVMECLPEEEQTLEYVYKLYVQMNECPPIKKNDHRGRTFFNMLFEQLERENPDSYAVRTWHLFSGNATADRMEASIRGILAERLNGLLLSSLIEMFSRQPQVDFEQIGHEKTALFLNVSDCDRSMDRLANLFYTQALQSLIDCADHCPGTRLPVPVRFILDDFATNVYIPDFENIISVIRSREISVSIIIQSLTQLNKLYGKDGAGTIVNNCDHILYLGGKDPETAEFIGMMTDQRTFRIMNMPVSQAWLIERGSAPALVDRCDA